MKKNICIFFTPLQVLQERDGNYTTQSNGFLIFIKSHHFVLEDFLKEIYECF